MPSIHTLNRFFVLYLLIALSSFLTTVLADHNTDQDGNGGMSSGIPTTSPKGNGDENNNGTTTASSNSTSLLGEQPMTVQLGAGFVVGCVTGVILYATVRLCCKVSQRNPADRRRRALLDRSHGETVPALVDV